MQEQTGRRSRNNPPIRTIIEQFLSEHPSGASFEQICKHVQTQAIKLISKTPRNSIYSVLVRMNNVERVAPATYRLRVL